MIIKIGLIPVALYIILGLYTTYYFKKKVPNDSYFCILYIFKLKKFLFLA